MVCRCVIPVHCLSPWQREAFMRPSQGLGTMGSRSWSCGLRLGLNLALVGRACNHWPCILKSASQAWGERWKPGLSVRLGPFGILGLTTMGFTGSWWPLRHHSSPSDLPVASLDLPVILGKMHVPWELGVNPLRTPVIFGIEVSWCRGFSGIFRIGWVCYGSWTWPYVHGNPQLLKHPGPGSTAKFYLSGYEVLNCVSSNTYKKKSFLEWK